VGNGVETAWVSQLFSAFCGVGVSAFCCSFLETAWVSQLFVSAFCSFLETAWVSQLFASQLFANLQSF
jgi:hypothetical protein